MGRPQVCHLNHESGSETLEVTNTQMGRLMKWSKMQLCWRLLPGIAPLFALIALSPFLPLLHGWYPDPQFAVAYSREALAVLAFFPILIALSPEASRLPIAFAYSVAGTALCLQAVPALALLAGTTLLSAAISATPWFAIRVALLVGAFFGLTRLAPAWALPSMTIFWLWGNLSRIVSWPNDQPRRLTPASVMRSFLHIAAAPFLIGPRPMGWLTAAYFERHLEFRITEEKLRRGRMLCLWGATLLLAGSIAVQRSQFLRVDIWNEAMLSQPDGGAFRHWTAGFGFFLLRYLQKGGLTAIVAGIWNLSGCAIRYDFDRPFLATNMLNFWDRYLNYGKEIFVRLVYLPTAIYASRVFPLGVSRAIAFATVLFAVAIYHFVGPLPLPIRMTAALTYTLGGCLKHSLLGGSLMAISYGFSMLTDRTLGKLGQPGRHAAWVAQIAFTWVCVSILFYSSYSLMLKNFPLSTFLRQVLVP